MERILGASMNNDQWLQASLPVSLGGLGLRSAEMHALGAYTSSFSESGSIIEEIIGGTKEHWRKKKFWLRSTL